MNNSKHSHSYLHSHAHFENNSTSMDGFHFGHLQGSVLFILFGIWHATNVFIAYLRSLRSNRKFEASAHWPLLCCRDSDFPIEGLLKLVVSFIMTLTQLGLADKSKWGTMLVQHLALYAFYSSSGLVDIVAHFATKRKWHWVPKSVDKSYLAFVFLMQSLFLSYHFHQGDDGSEEDSLEHHVFYVSLHTFLSYITTSLGVVLLAELFAKQQLFGLSLIRSSLLTMIGCWYFSIDLLNMSETNSVQVATVAFSMSAISALAITSTMGLIVWALMKSSSEDYDKLPSYMSVSQQQDQDCRGGYNGDQSGSKLLSLTAEE